MNEATRNEQSGETWRAFWRYLAALASLLAAGAWVLYSHTALALRLQSALERGDYPAVRRYVALGAPINTLWQPLDNGGGDTPLWAAWSAHDLPYFRELLHRGADPNVTSAEGITILMQATSDLRLMRLLVAKGADVNAESGQGWTPLMSAAQAGEAEAVKFLLAHGADKHHRHVNGWTALNLARDGGHPELIPLLR